MTLNANDALCAREPYLPEAAAAHEYLSGVVEGWSIFDDDLLNRLMLVMDANALEAILSQLKSMANVLDSRELREIQLPKLRVCFADALHVQAR